MPEEKNQGLDRLDVSLKTLAKSSLIVLISLFLARVLGYLYRFVIAKYLGPEQYGLYTLALIVLSVFIAVCSFGITEGILRFIALYRGKNQTDKTRYLFGFSSTFLIISSLIFGAILFFASSFISINIFHNSNLVVYLKSFSIMVPISIIASLFLNILRAYEKIKVVSFLSNILLHVIKLGLLIFLIFLSLKSGAIILSYSIALLIVLILAYFICKHAIPEIFSKYSIKKSEKKEIKTSLFSYSWPILFISLAGSILYWIDSFTLGYFKNAVDVGFYNAAIPLAALFVVTSEIFMQLFYPMITREYAKNNLKLIKEVSKQIGKWIFIINLPVFLIMLLFPGVILNVLFGSQYLAAENSLRILAVSMFFISITTISNTLLLMIGKSRLNLIFLFSVSVINIILDIILVPKYGLIGAAIPTMACQVLLGVLTVYAAHKYTGIIPFRRKMLGISLISLIPLAIVLIIKKFVAINFINMIIIGVLFVAVYLFLVFITKGFDKNDVMIIKSIKKKMFSKSSFRSNLNN